MMLCSILPQIMRGALGLGANGVAQIKAAEPPISKVHMDFITQKLKQIKAFESQPICGCFLPIALIPLTGPYRVI